MAVELSIACGDRDLNRSLLEGNVEPHGVDATTVAVFPSERHRRFVRHGEFDVAEMSLATLLATRSDPERYPFTAIPVFPNKRFRHSFFYKRKDADIDSPPDLAGHNVGISSWQTTANVWMRGIAAEYYGLDLEAVHWFRRKDDDADMTVPQRFDVSLIQSQPGTSVNDRANLERALLAGDVDAVMDPSRSLFDTAVSHPDVEFMFDDPVQEERDYFKETGIHPPMHTVVVRDEILKDHPWVARSLYDAFEASKDRCIENNVILEKTSLTWAHLHRVEQRAVLGDTWEYGLTEANKRALRKLVEYATDQGLIEQPIEIEELFYESTL